MLVWGNLECFQHGLYLQASCLQCGVGTGMLHLAVGSFKPCGAGASATGSSTSVIEKDQGGG